MIVKGSKTTAGVLEGVDHVNDATKPGDRKSASDARVRRTQNHSVCGRAHAVNGPDEDAEARGIHERDTGEVYDDVRIEGRSLTQRLA